MNEAKEKAIEELTREIFRLHPDVPCWAKGNDEMFTKTMAYMARLGFDAGFTAGLAARSEFVTPFPCHHCSVLIGHRTGDTLKTREGVEIEFKETHNIRCAECQRHTRFGVSARTETD